MEGIPLAHHHVVIDLAHGVRQADDDAGENDERHAIADAAFGDLLTQPHNKGRAGGEGDDGHHGEAEAGVDDESATHGAGASGLQHGGNGGRLEKGQADGEIAGPLGNLAASELAFFGELLKSGNDHSE